MSKLLVTADIHLHEWRSFSSLKNSVNTRLLDILSVLQQEAVYARKNGITSVAILGDIFHKRGQIDVTSYNLFHQFLKTYEDLHFYILVGNHDQSTIDGKFNACAPLARLNTTIISVPTHITIMGKDVFFVPYIHNHTTTQCIIEDTSADYLFGHFSVAGAKVIDTDYRTKEGVRLTKNIQSKYNKILLGHYHTPQYLSKNRNSMYVGSPIHHSFSDENQEKSFIVLTMDSGSVERVATKYPNFVRFTVKSDKEMDEILTKQADYYRIICQDFVPSSVQLEKLNDAGVTFEICLENSSIKGARRRSQGISIESGTLAYLINNCPVNRRIELFKEIQNRLNTC